jgi:hypothetical protein
MPARAIASMSRSPSRASLDEPLIRIVICVNLDLLGACYLALLSRWKADDSQSRAY